MAYRSFFSYNVTRAYPFKWFTPVVVIGAIITIALVSFLNVAATGYELATVSSQDPDLTESNAVWFTKWPSFLVGSRASCDATTLPLGSTIYTNNIALPYKLSAVWKSGENGTKVDLGSLIYKRNPIQQCSVKTVAIQFEGPDRAARQIAVFVMGGPVTAIIECFVESDSPSDRTYFQLVTSYDAIPPLTDASSNFLSRTKVNGLSMFWGYSLLAMYWRSVMQEYYIANVPKSRPYYKGIVTMSQNTSANFTKSRTIEEQLNSLDFFRISCYLVPLNSTGVNLNPDHCDTDSISALSAGNLVPNIWPSVDMLGKAMWSTVLADLGRDDSDMPNMLTRPELLAYLSSNLTQVNQTLGPSFRWGLAQIQPFMQSFDPSQPQEAQLGINSSVLSTEYVCQVPRLKAPGTLFISVLIADLVILQALWKIFTLLVDGILIKNKEEAQECAAHSHAKDSVTGYASVSQDELLTSAPEVRRSLGT